MRPSAALIAAFLTGCAAAPSPDPVNRPLVVPGAFETFTVPKEHDRIRVPQRIFDGCYAPNAKVQSFGAPTQTDYALALARESNVHDDCTKLQKDTLGYLKEALGRLRDE